MSTLKVEGVKGTLITLRKIDPQLRKAFNANVKQITKPMVDDAKNQYRTIQYPSGTARNWQQKGRPKFPLTNAQSVRGVSAKVSTSKRNSSTIVVVQSNAGASIFEFASGGNLGASFKKKNGGTPRVMWPAADRHLQAVTDNMADLVRQAELDITQELN